MKKITKKILSLALAGNMISLVPNFASAEGIKFLGMNFKKSLQGAYYNISANLAHYKPSFRYKFSQVCKCGGEEVLIPISNFSEDRSCLFKVEQDGMYTIRLEVIDLDEKSPSDRAEITITQPLNVNWTSSPRANKYNNLVRLTRSGDKSSLNSLMQQINGLPQLKKRLSESQIVKIRENIILGIDRVISALNYIVRYNEELRGKIEILTNELNLCRNNLRARHILGQDELERLGQALEDVNVNLSREYAEMIDKTSIELLSFLFDYNEDLAENAKNRKILSIYDLMQNMDSMKANQCIDVKNWYASMGIDEEGRNPMEIFRYDIMPLFSERDVEYSMNIDGHYLDTKPSENPNVTVMTFPGLSLKSLDFKTEYRVCLGNSTKLFLDNGQVKELKGFIVSTDKAGGHYCSFVRDKFDNWYCLDDDNAAIKFDSFDEVLDFCNYNNWHFNMAFFEK